MKKIAIIGTGVSGLTCGHLLHKHYDVTLFEKNDYIGGHTATVDVVHSGINYTIDTGFIVFNDRTYPYFEKLLKHNTYKKVTTYVGLAIIAAYFMTTFNQNKIWKNSETLWSHVLKYYKNSTLPYGNLANYLRDQGRYKEAMVNYNKSLELKPNQSGVLNSRAKLYFTSSNNRDTINLALSDYNRALELDPDNAEVLINRGATLARLGRMDEALQSINQGIAINPQQLSGYSNRSVLYVRTGRYAEALQDIETYLSYKPYDADFWYESGSIKGVLGRAGEGIEDIYKAISINPQKGVYYYRLAELLASMNRMEEGRQALENAMARGFRNIDPSLRSRLTGN